MIRKPPVAWQREESGVVRTARTAAEVARGGAMVTRKGGHAARGLFCFFFAILWGYAALAGGLLAGSMPTFIGVGAMVALTFWAGKRAVAEARER
jgi:hypothetical protein